MEWWATCSTATRRRWRLRGRPRTRRDRRPGGRDVRLPALLSAAPRLREGKPLRDSRDARTHRLYRDPARSSPCSAARRAAVMGTRADVGGYSPTPSCHHPRHRWVIRRRDRAGGRERPKPRELPRRMAGTRRKPSPRPDARAAAGGVRALRGCCAARLRRPCATGHQSLPREQAWSNARSHVVALKTTASRWRPRTRSAGTADALRLARLAARLGRGNGRRARQDRGVF